MNLKNYLNFVLKHSCLYLNGDESSFLCDLMKQINNNSSIL